MVTATAKRKIKRAQTSVSVNLPKRWAELIFNEGDTDAELTLVDDCIEVRRWKSEI